MFRRVVLVMVVLLMSALVAGISQAAIAQQASPVARDDFAVDLGDRSLQVACRGTGSPTLVQEIGGPDPAGGVGYLHEGGDFISGLIGTRFCGYDRAGTGQSQPDPTGIRTLSDAGADLLAVLAAPDVGCPCIVAGESLGGGIVLAALVQDASNFASLMLLDTLLPGFSETVVELAPAGSDEVGLGSFFAGQNEEMINYHMTDEMVPAEAQQFPVRVLTHGAGDPPPCPCSVGYPADQLEVAWQQGQIELADQLGVEVIIAENTGHGIAEENPELVVEVLLEVIAELNA